MVDLSRSVVGAGSFEPKLTKMLLRILHFLVWSLCCSTLMAGNLVNAPLDSLEAVLETEKDIENRADISLTIAGRVMHDDAKKARDLLLPFLDDQRELDDLRIGKIFMKLGQIYYYLEDYEACEKYSLKSIETGESIGDNKMIAGSHNTISNMHYVLGDLSNSNLSLKTAIKHLSLTDDTLSMAKFQVNLGLNLKSANQGDEAIKVFFEALKIFENMQDAFGMGVTYTNIGASFLMLDNYPEGQKYSEKALSVLGPEAEYYRVMAYNNLGTSLTKLNRLDKAEEAYMNAIKANKNNSTFSKSHSIYGLANLAVERGDKATAKERFTELLELETEAGLMVEQMSTLYSLAKLYREEKAYAKCLSCIERAEAIIVKTEVTKDYADILEGKLLCSLEQKGEKALLNNFEKYLEIADTTFNLQKDELTKEINAKYETEKKDQENRLYKEQEKAQTAEIQRRTYQLTATVLGLLLVSGFLWYFWRSNIKRRKNNRILQNKNKLLNEKKEQIQLLNTELNHRVRNNLQLVSSLMEMQAFRLDDDRAKAAFLESQNRLQAMRSVYNKLSSEASSRTIDLSAYLLDLCQHLERTFSHQSQHLNIQMTPPGEPVICGAEKSLSIGLILNELITNAVKYAFTDQEKPQVDVVLKKGKDEDLELFIKDNGSGILDDQQAAREGALGTKLIELLVGQLKGQMQQRNNNGLEYTFRFDNNIT